eukprot:scaffold1503_cov150-Ochromonas_danica.AAC.22
MNENALFGPGVESIWTTKKRKRSSNASLSGAGISSDHVNRLGEAELLFIQGKCAEAIAVLSEIAREVPKWSEPYTILALIYDSLGQKTAALQLFSLCATFQSNRGKIRSRTRAAWKKVAHYAFSLGEYEQALNAIQRCLRYETGKEEGGGGGVQEEAEEEEEESGGIVEEEEAMQRLRVLSLFRLYRVRPGISILKTYSSSYPLDLSLYLTVADGCLAEGYPLTALRYYKTFLSLMGIQLDPPPAPATNLLEMARGNRLIRIEGSRWAERPDEVCYALRLACYLILQEGVGGADEAQQVVEAIETLFAAHHTLSSSSSSSSAVLPSFPLDLLALLAYAKLVLTVQKTTGTVSDPDPGPALLVLNPLQSVLFPAKESKAEEGIQDEQQEEEEEESSEDRLAIYHILLLCVEKLQQCGCLSRARLPSASSTSEEVFLSIEDYQLRAFVCAPRDSKVAWAGFSLATSTATSEEVRRATAGYFHHYLSHLLKEVCCSFQRPVHRRAQRIANLGELGSAPLPQSESEGREEMELEEQEQEEEVVQEEEDLMASRITVKARPAALSIGGEDDLSTSAQPRPDEEEEEEEEVEEEDMVEAAMEALLALPSSSSSSSSGHPGNSANPPSPLSSHAAHETVPETTLSSTSSSISVVTKWCLRDLEALLSSPRNLFLPPVNIFSSTSSSSSLAQVSLSRSQLTAFYTFSVHSLYWLYRECAGSGRESLSSREHYLALALATANLTYRYSRYHKSSATGGGGRLRELLPLSEIIHAANAHYRDCSFFSLPHYRLQPSPSEARDKKKKAEDAAGSDSPSQQQWRYYFSFLAVTASYTTQDLFLILEDVAQKASHDDPSLGGDGVYGAGELLVDILSHAISLLDSTHEEERVYLDTVLQYLRRTSSLCTASAVQRRQQQLLTALRTTAEEAVEKTADGSGEQQSEETKSVARRGSQQDRAAPAGGLDEIQNALRHLLELDPKLLPEGGHRSAEEIFRDLQCILAAAGGGGGEGEAPGWVWPSLSLRRLLVSVDEYVEKAKQHPRLAADPFAIQAAKLHLLGGSMQESFVNYLAHCLSSMRSSSSEEGVGDDSNLPEPCYLEDVLPMTTSYYLSRNAYLVHYLLAQEEAVFKRHGSVVDHFLQALDLLAKEAAASSSQDEDDNEVLAQPVVYLSLAGYLIMLAAHPIMKQRGELLQRSWAMLLLYATSRIRTLQSFSSSEDNYHYHYHYLSALQEVCYNFGRACMEMGMDHLAVSHYHRVLEVQERFHSFPLKPQRLGGQQQQEEEGEEGQQELPLTRKAAHNLVVIYQEKSRPLAWELMQRYLSFP